MVWCGSGSSRDKDIRDLSRQDLFEASDIVPVYSGTNRDDRGVTGQAILDFINENVVVPTAPLTQYATPTTGQTVTTAPLVAGQSVRLLITPLGTLAALTVVLPGGGLAALPVDRQEVYITSTQSITALTVSAGTTSVVGAWTALTANIPFKMFYDATNAAWYVSP